MRQWMLLALMAVFASASYAEICTSSDIFCYQESPNASTSCGGLSNGTYLVTRLTTGWPPYCSFYDCVYPPDYTGHNKQSYIYANYSIPANASVNGSLWQVKYGCTVNSSGGCVVGSDPYFLNISIPTRCASNGVLQFRLISYKNGLVAPPAVAAEAYGQCYNGSAWENITPISQRTVWVSASMSTTTWSYILDGNYSTGSMYDFVNNMYLSVASNTSTGLMSAYWYEEGVYWKIGVNTTCDNNPWICSPEHPEGCWTIDGGNSSRPSYYDACVQNITQYGQNKSYVEKYLTCNFARLVGNAQMGGIMLALMVLGVFLAFVMMQNTRLDGKLVVMIPVIILVSVWMGWILWIVGFVIGTIIALAILRLITR